MISCSHVDHQVEAFTSPKGSSPMQSPGPKNSEGEPPVSRKPVILPSKRMSAPPGTSKPLESKQDVDVLHVLLCFSPVFHDISRIFKDFESLCSKVNISPPSQAEWLMGSPRAKTLARCCQLVTRNLQAKARRQL